MSKGYEGTVEALCKQPSIRSAAMYAEFRRVKSLIDTGYFGELTFEQIGKLHTELCILERTFKSLMMAREGRMTCNVVINVSDCNTETLQSIQQQMADAINDVRRRRGLDLL